MKLTIEHLKELIREAIANEQRMPRNIKNSIFRILQILKDDGPTEARDLPPHLLTIAGSSALKRAVQANLIALVPGTEYATYKITEHGLEAFPFLRLGMAARNEPIDEGISNMKLTIEQLKRIIKETIQEQTAQGAGVNTAVAPPAEGVKKEQAGILGKLGKLSTGPLDREKKSPGGKPAIYRISSGDYVTMGFGAGTSAPEAIANFLVTNGHSSSKEAAISQTHHFEADLMSPGSLAKEEEKLNADRDKADALLDSLDDAYGALTHLSRAR